MTPAETLERTQWDTFWVPPDTEIVDRPDLLLLGCPRPVGYLNVVLRTRAAPAALPALVTEVEHRQGTRHTRWMVTDTTPESPLESALGAAGWTPGVHHEVRVRAVSGWDRRPTVEVQRVVTMAQLAQCVDVTLAAFGSPRTFRPADLDAELHACRDGRKVSRFVAMLDGRPVAAGGLTAFPELGFGLLWAGATLAEARGRGAYASLLAARIAHARRLGLGAVGLYAVADTSAPIVARFGFGSFGEMRFWERG